MADFASDSFTGSIAQQELSAYSSVWSKQTGHADNIVIGQDAQTYCMCTSASAYGVYQHSASPAGADYSVFVDVTQLAGTLRPQYGACGRMQAAADTFYATLHFTTPNQTRLYKWVSGTPTQLGSSYANTIGNGNTQTHELRMAGTTISAYVGATLAVTTTDSAISTAGKAGIIGFSMRDTGVADTGKIDNFRANEASAAASPVRMLFKLQAVNRSASY